ncbi:MAG TPA: VirB8/TrbF family protein [Noviherbaspirillum sp.]|nr:VirB8/TrbF family protein [Noviherbaspirillum sp.]
MSATGVKLSENATTFLREQIDWNQSSRDELEEKSKRRLWSAIAGWTVASISIATVIPLIALHEFIPIQVVVDRRDGTYEVKVGKERIDIHDQKNEQRMIADIGRFVNARWGFTRGEAENNFRIVYYSLPAEMRPAWEQEYRPELNKRSPLNIYGPKDQVKIVNPSITWLPSDNDKYKVAQFRFDLEKRLQGKAPTRQPYVATLTYNYDPANVPGNIEGLIANAFGFTVINHRADPSGPEREIPDVSTGGQ